MTVSITDTLRDAGITEQVYNSITRDELREFILERFPLARQKPAGDSDPLLENGLVDSLGILELVNYITETFGVVVTDEDLRSENFNSIDNLVAFVERQAD